MEKNMKTQWIKIICLMVLAVFVLSACQPGAVATQPGPAEEKNTQPAEGNTAEPTNAAEQPNPAQSPAGEKCHVKQSLFPPVKESDWIMGSKDAKTTILEYSDFM